MKYSEVDREKLSPMMAQYMAIKDNYQDEILFYRLGDFYEMFFDDAIKASRELELTLTSRASGLDEKAPMCGIPHNNIKPYIEKLVNKGYKVAICEQLEDPKTTKGMVKRGVIDVISKGTIIDQDMLNEKESSYIASIVFYSDIIVLTIADISSCFLGSLTLQNDEEELINQILKYNIKEVLLLDNTNVNLIDVLKNTYNIEVSINPNYLWEEYSYIYDSVSDVRKKSGIAHLFYYLSKRQLKDLSYIKNVEILSADDNLEMDIHTVRNLELVETIRLKERTYSLIWLLDKCSTAMGSRKLKSWLLNPLKNEKLINERLDKIDTLNKEFILESSLKKCLMQVYDIERLAGKVVNGNINARDLIQLRNSLNVLPEIKDILNKLKFNYNFSIHSEIASLLNKSILDDAVISIHEGGMIKEGYSQELDNLKKIRSGGKEFVAGIEAKLKSDTGIKNLKVGFNKVFGYFIEVPNSSKSLVKDEFNWYRKQTLTGSERYISPELKEQENLILNAEDEIVNLEYNLFMDIKEKVKMEVIDLFNTSSILSEIDALVSLSECSSEYNLVRPTFNNNHTIDIKDGRHPVVEYVNKYSYVANDCVMDKDIDTLIITGPNMSGKSTYMRQLAIIIIMAQMGSFVPCSSANLPIVDKIFTRIGASDDLVSGESTFMVEMREANRAIKNATENSLILFDELGRGTATYDGMSIAQAILEYTSQKIHSYTLFSTHYHELTKLDKVYKNIKNIHVSAIEDGNTLTFLHKVDDGAVDKSYGIHVARLAGMPDELIENATNILSSYEANPKRKTVVQLSMDLNEEEKTNKLEEKIKTVDLLNTTPIDALNILYELKNEITDKK